MPVTAPPRNATCSAALSPCRAGGAHVGAYRDVHADVAGQSRQHRTDREPARRDPVQRESEHNEQHHAYSRDRDVLAIQVGLGPGLNRRGNLLHALVAGRQREDRAHRHDAVEHGDYARGYCHPQPVRGTHAISSRSLYLAFCKPEWTELRSVAQPKIAAKYITRWRADRCSSELESGLEPAPNRDAADAHVAGQAVAIGWGILPGDQRLQIAPAGRGDPKAVVGDEMARYLLLDVG